MLAFNDSQCTTICPLTTTTMIQAKAMLGRAGADVALLGVNANPEATAVKWVRAYSQAHGMLHQWQFLTGSAGQLRRVWSAYHIEAQVDAGQIDHTPALYVIDRRGRLAKLYLTSMAYASLTQQAQILAREIASLLPSHPAVHSGVSYDTVSTYGPASRVALPLALGRRTTTIGGRGAPQLLMFFATWLQRDVEHRLRPRPPERLRGDRRCRATPATRRRRRGERRTLTRRAPAAPRRAPAAPRLPGRGRRKRPRR